MKRSTRGFYTVEAVIFLPVVILMILSLGYFMKIEGLWENCYHGALDENAMTASRAYNRAEALTMAENVRKRVSEDNPELDRLEIKDIKMMYSDGTCDNLISYTFNAEERLKLPMGFDRDFKFEGKIKFRGFVGTETKGKPLGKEGLEKLEAENPVWVFLQSGKRYHGERCRYVKTSVHTVILTSGIREKYKACGICNSEDMAIGSIVFCFQSAGSSYHRRTCRTIDRHSTIMDETEAIIKGYTPCSICGGK